MSGSLLALQQTALAIPDSYFEFPTYLPRTFGQDTDSADAAPSQSNSVTSPSLNLETIRRLIQNPQIRSVETLLTAIPESQRQTYALVYHSGSEQAASFESPRVVLTNPANRFFMAFSGKPEDQTVELMQADAQGRFHLTRVSFHNNAPATVEENPQSCLRCHGNPPRANWDSYPNWRGVYGSVDDCMLHGSPEYRGYRSYLARRSHVPRLLALPLLAEIDLNEEHRRSPGSGMVVSVSPPHRRDWSCLRDANGNEPNSLISDTLSLPNARRVVRQIQESPAYNSFKYSIAASALGCFNGSDENATGPFSLEEFFPTGLREAGVDVSIMESQISSQIASEFRHRMRAINRNNPHYRFTTDADVNTANQFAQYQYIMDRMGVSTQFWSLSPPPGRYSFASPRVTINNIFGPLFLRTVRAQQDRDLMEILDRSPTVGEACAQLRARSLAMTGTSETAILPCHGAATDPLGHSHLTSLSRSIAQRSLGGAVALESCARCHNAFPPAVQQGPRIPFDNDRRLSRYLSTHPGARHEILNRLQPRHPRPMPPADPLLPEEARALRLYLQQL